MFTKKCNKSDYLEFQICRVDTKLKQLVNIDNISFNDEESIYLDLDCYDKFLLYYRNYFNSAIHNNLEVGLLDIYGINYYTLDETKSIINDISKDKPKNC